MKRRAYFPPRVFEYEAKLSPISEPKGASFDTLRPMYAVYRAPGVTIVAVRFRFDGDREYRFWQAVSAVSTSVAVFGEPALPEYTLLGFVPPNLPFDVQVLCRDERSSYGIAELRQHVARDNTALELVVLNSLK